MRVTVIATQFDDKPHLIQEPEAKPEEPAAEGEPAPANPFAAFAGEPAAAENAAPAVEDEPKNDPKDDPYGDIARIFDLNRRR